ncbi:Hsp70 protein [Stackebrandtia albiflava]|uniref:Hsp70 protein n=1 Tax=Stackebrandtia albiflava TaxID=406432 RepID=A0A562V101_9ACTN|nr:Hsp70 family protein [Stackebrandtia albiflava]TWJ11558.1 Hsp70 protein [Stackebrandtia albiflava]
MSDAVPLGVDFGTSHTVAVVRTADAAFTPLLFDGSPMLPSAVYAEPGGALVVGREALHAMRLEPARFEPNPKRCVDDGAVLLGDREVPVADMIGAVLARVGEEYTRVVGTAPGSVTLTHPAAWASTRRVILLDAAARAGWREPRLVPEPVAAAARFAASRGVAVGSAVVVADFGGGTFDCAVVRRTGTGFEVVEVDGRERLGGVDVDEALVRRFRDRVEGDAEWRRLLAPETAADRRHRRSLYDDVRSAKELLSRRQSAEIFLPVFDRDSHLTRAELEETARPLLEEATRVTGAVMRLAGVQAGEVAGLFLVGGGSRMPLVATMLHHATGIVPTVWEQPELVVAQGALLTAAPAVPVAGGGTVPVPASRAPASPAQAVSAPIPRRDQPPGPARTEPYPVSPGAPPVAEPAAHRRPDRPARLWVVRGLLAVQVVFMVILAPRFGGYFFELGAAITFSIVVCACIVLSAVRHRVALWTCVALQFVLVVGLWTI